MRMVGVLLTACASLLLGGCVTFNNLDGNATLDEASDQTIVVLGVRPSYRVAILGGEIVRGEVKERGIAVVNSFPENGYIVVKVKSANAPDEYHISQVLPEGIGKGGYSACNGDPVVTFSAPPGKVVYVGDINLNIASGRLSFGYRNDFDAANRFIEAHYPKLKGRLEPQKLALLPITGRGCAPMHITVPIMVGR
jgi:hypothetical protein